jgi:hypothetical protein
MVKKIYRAREGKVWVGYFRIWETTRGGKRVRRKKEKTLGPASKPRHEALRRLADLHRRAYGKACETERVDFYLYAIVESFLCGEGGPVAEKDQRES